MGNREFAEGFRKKDVRPAGGQSRPPLQGRAGAVVGADDSVGPMRSYEFAEEFRKKQYILPGRCGHRPLQRLYEQRRKFLICVLALSNVSLTTKTLRIRHRRSLLVAACRSLLWRFAPMILSANRGLTRAGFCAMMRSVRGL